MSGQQKQSEEHFMASDIFHDIVIGMSNGLTVPFAIAAGMSGAAVSATVVVIAGRSSLWHRLADRVASSSGPSLNQPGCRARNNAAVQRRSAAAASWI